MCMIRMMIDNETRVFCITTTPEINHENRLTIP